MHPGMGIGWIPACPRCSARKKRAVNRKCGQAVAVKNVRLNKNADICG